MTKAAAIYNFWSGFGIPAYEENSVPSGKDAPEFPYVTYQLITDSFGADVAMTASLWYRDSSWVNANAKPTKLANLSATVEMSFSAMVEASGSSVVSRSHRGWETLQTR